MLPEIVAASFSSRRREGAVSPTFTGKESRAANSRWSRMSGARRPAAEKRISISLRRDQEEVGRPAGQKPSAVQPHVRSQLFRTQPPSLPISNETSDAKSVPASAKCVRQWTPGTDTLWPTAKTATRPGLTRRVHVQISWRSAAPLQTLASDGIQTALQPYRVDSVTYPAQRLLPPGWRPSSTRPGDWKVSAPRPKWPRRAHSCSMGRQTFPKLNLAVRNEDIFKKNKQNVLPPPSRSSHASWAVRVIDKQDVMFPALPLVRAGIGVLF